MCFGDLGEAPVEFKTEELKERGPNGERVIQPVLTIWNSVPCRDVDMVSGRWEGSREYGMTWEQFLELHESMSNQIAFLKPLIEAGKIVAK